MTQRDIDRLCILVDKKIEQLEKYDDISVRFLIDEIDKFKTLLEVRHTFLVEFNKLTPQIDRIIEAQSQDDQEVLKRMFTLKEFDHTEDAVWQELKQKLIKMKERIDSINEKTRKTEERFEAMKMELLSEMQKLKKSKQVIDFISSTTKTDLFRGKAMDQKM